MEISNKKRSRNIRRGFHLGAVFLLLPVLFFVWKEMDIAALVSGTVLVLFVIASQFVELNYIHYQSDGERLLIQYYPLITFFGKEYSSIEFNKRSLFKAKVEKSFLFYELSIEVKTKKGLAEYPAVSLAALSKNEVRAIKHDLAEIALLK